MSCVDMDMTIAEGSRVTYRQFIVFAGVLALHSGCNSEQLPVNASLVISPEQRSYEIADNRNEDGSCFIDPEYHIDMPFVVRLAGPEGSPIGGVTLEAYVSLASNTFSGYPVLSLYEDRNGNGIVDADSELVSNVGDDLASLRTDDVSGSYSLLVRANLSCAYRGEVFVFGHGVSASASIGVSIGASESSFSLEIDQ